MMMTDEVFPVQLPRSVESIEWKVESTATRLTLCEIYDPHG